MFRAFRYVGTKKNNNYDYDSLVSYSFLAKVEVQDN